MSLEETAALGECLSPISSKRDISLALSVYETWRKKRTTRVVQRGNPEAPLSLASWAEAAGERHQDDCADSGRRIPRVEGSGI